jgi:periplasmic protein TonB
MNRSTAALIIAILFHLVLLLLFWLLGITIAEQKKPEKTQEQRIKVALREMPKAKRNAALENKIPPTKKIPPMPKGSQLKSLPKPVERTRPLPKPQEQIAAKAPEPVKPQEKIPTPKRIAEPQPPAQKTAAVPPEKPYIPFLKTPEEQASKETPKPETNATEIPKAHQKLFAKLSKKQENAEAASSPATVAQRASRIPKDIREAYGDAFGKLSAGERKYLLDNQEIMRSLTQAQLDDTGRTMIPNTLRVNDDNIVEFYLHPDGSMTGFRFIRHSGFFLLDEVTKETIESVYWKYPRPKQTTLIRYKFGYFLRGY